MSEDQTRNLSNSPTAAPEPIAARIAQLMANTEDFMTKVKVFVATQTQDGSSPDSPHLEYLINDWLSANPDVEIVDIKLSICPGTGKVGAPPKRQFETTQAVVLIHYREKQ